MKTEYKEVVYACTLHLISVLSWPAPPCDVSNFGELKRLAFMKYVTLTKPAGKALSTIKF